jgi:hypothetical protein
MMGELSSAAISNTGQAVYAKLKYKPATTNEPALKTQRREAPNFCVNITTAMCEPCCAAMTTPDMIIHGNISSGSSDAHAKLVPAAYRKHTLALRITKTTDKVRYKTA